MLELGLSHACWARTKASSSLLSQSEGHTIVLGVIFTLKIGVPPVAGNPQQLMV